MVFLYFQYIPGSFLYVVNKRSEDSFFPDTQDSDSQIHNEKYFDRHYQYQYIHTPVSCLRL